MPTTIPPEYLARGRVPTEIPPEFLASPLSMPTKLPPALAPTAPPAAKEGAAASENTPAVQPVENAFKPGTIRNTAPAAPSLNLIPSLGRAFGIPSTAVDPNQPGGIGRSFAIAPGLVFDPSVPGGVRKEDTGINEILAKNGLTDVNVSEIQRISRGEPAIGLPGTAGYRGSVSGGGALGGPLPGELSQSQLFADPTFRAAFNASMETIGSEFATARQQLAASAARNGIDTNSDQYRSALGDLIRGEARQRSQAILDAAAHVKAGSIGSETPFAASVNSDLDVQRITQQYGATVGGLAKQILDAKAKAKTYASDIESVQGSAKTFLPLAERSVEAIRRGQSAERQRREASAVGDIYKYQDFGPEISPATRLKLGADIEKRNKEAQSAARDAATTDEIRKIASKLGVNIPPNVTPKQARDIMNAQISTNREDRDILEADRANAIRSAAEARAQEEFNRETTEHNKAVAAGAGPADLKIKEEARDAARDKRDQAASDRANSEIWTKRFKAGLDFVLGGVKSVTGVLKEGVKQIGISSRAAASKAERSQEKNASNRQDLYDSVVAKLEADVTNQIKSIAKDEILPARKHIENIEQTPPEKRSTDQKLTYSTYTKRLKDAENKINFLRNSVTGAAVAREIRKKQNQSLNYYYSESQLKIIEAETDPNTIARPPIEAPTGVEYGEESAGGS